MGGGSVALSPGRAGRGAVQSQLPGSHLGSALCLSPQMTAMGCRQRPQASDTPCHSVGAHTHEGWGQALGLRVRWPVGRGPRFPSGRGHPEAPHPCLRGALLGCRPDVDVGPWLVPLGAWVLAVLGWGWPHSEARPARSLARSLTLVLLPALPGGTRGQGAAWGWAPHHGPLPCVVPSTLLSRAPTCRA